MVARCIEVFEFYEHLEEWIWNDHYLSSFVFGGFAGQVDLLVYKINAVNGHADDFLRSDEAVEYYAGNGVEGIVFCRECVFHCAKFCWCEVGDLRFFFSELRDSFERI